MVGFPSKRSYLKTWDFNDRPLPKNGWNLLEFFEPLKKRVVDPQEYDPPNPLDMW